MITPICGDRFKNVLSYSHASATKRLPFPTPEPPPISSMSPPITKVGSHSAFFNIVEIIAPVVVFPCVPLTAIPHLFLIKEPKNSEYLTTLNPNIFAFIRSGLFSLMAAEVITKFVYWSIPFPSWLVLILTPSFSRLCVMGEFSRSEPDTKQPSFIKILAIALIPTPPIPMK